MHVWCCVVLCCVVLCCVVLCCIFASCYWQPSTSALAAGSALALAFALGVFALALSLVLVFFLKLPLGLPLASIASKIPGGLADEDEALAIPSITRRLALEDEALALAYHGVRRTRAGAGRHHCAGRLTLMVAVGTHVRSMSCGGLQAGHFA